MQDITVWLQRWHLDFIQVAVLVLGVTEVLLARANNIWLYPAGIIATILSIYSLFGAQLYAECLLHLYYIVMSFYGWWYWITKKNNKKVEITFTTYGEWKITIFIAAAGWILLYFSLKTFTPSQVPAWDAWVSSTGWAGMWLLARRKAENWLVLNISNLFAIPLLFYKDLPLFAVLTIVLFLVACKGYVDWMAIARKRIHAQ
jgi:nicotinamide mononucleotide transporter